MNYLFIIELVLNYYFELLSNYGIIELFWMIELLWIIEWLFWIIFELYWSVMNYYKLLLNDWIIIMNDYWMIELLWIIIELFEWLWIILSYYWNIEWWLCTIIEWLNYYELLWIITLDLLLIYWRGEAVEPKAARFSRHGRRVIGSTFNNTINSGTFDW